MSNRKLFKYLPFVFILILSEISFGQSSTGQVISGYNKGEMELFILPFGMENPIPVGKISASGQVQLNWPEKLAVKDQDLSLYLTAFDYAVNLKCDSEGFQEKATDAAFAAGNIFLMKGGEQQGVLTMVSAPALADWLEDPGYKNATPGIYCNWVYATRDTIMKGSCPASLTYNDKTIQGTYRYDISLKKGFNLLVNEIQSVFKTDESIMAHFPDKIFIHTEQPQPQNVVFHLKTFY